MSHDITKIFPEIELDVNGNPYANKKKTPPGFARLMQPALKKSWLETDLLKEVEEWRNKVIKKLYILEDQWLWENIQRAGMTYGDVGIKTRCKTVKQNKSHIWYNTLYIDDKIVSILSVNSVTLEATVENIDGFTSKGTI